MENIPSVETFDSVLGDDRSTNAGPLWDKWVKRFENYVVAINITTEARKRALLLHLVGPRTYEEFETLSDTGADYETAKNKLTDFFKPKVNVEYEKIQFRMTKQKVSESIDQYHTRLRQAATTCNFQNVNAEIKSQLIQTMRDSKVRKKALNTEMTLDAIVKEARSNELCRLQNSQIERQLGASGGASKSNSQQSVNKTVGTGGSDRKCYSCGNAYPHQGGMESCPAHGKKCRACGKLNHFAKLCKSRAKSKTGSQFQQKSQPQSRNRNTGKHRDRHSKGVNEIRHSQDCDNSSMFYDSDSDSEDVSCELDSSDDCNQFLFQLGQKSGSGTGFAREQFANFLVKVGKTPLVMTADTAATCCIVDENTYQSKLNHLNLRRTSTRINPYNAQPIYPIGKLRCKIKCGDKHIYDTIFVVPGNSGCLLSLSASKALGLVEIASHTVNNVSSGCGIQQFLKENPALTQGIGRYKAKRFKLHVNESKTPVVQKVRRLPFHTRAKVEKEINRLLDEGIIERADGPTTYVSPIVVVPKKDGEVRVCTDMKCANEAIIRERHPLPTVDDLVDRLNGCTVFSKIDLKQGYLQLELEPESRHITTFVCHLGLFRSKRLSFGINSASEIFQKAVQDTICHVKQTINISDDIIIGGKDIKDHDNQVLKVLKALLKAGFTINLPKCRFRQSELDFFGLNFTSEGIRPDSSKIEALTKLKPPASVGEVHSLLGMLTYSSRFIPRFSTLTAPIRKLLKADVKFEWAVEQQKAFDSLMEILSRRPVLSYFDINKDTEIFVDASPVGVAGILTQKDSEGNLRPVAYGSRSLTEVEQRYSQLEREALAVVWSCEHFHIYIYGKDVMVHTDHKPLLGIFGKPRVQLPTRLERWNLRLQPYSPKLLYQVGSSNPADYLSRHPSQFVQSRSREECISEQYVNFVVNHAIPKAVTKREIHEAVQSDDTLLVVSELVKSGKWKLVDNSLIWGKNVDIAELKSYQKVRNELTLTADNILLKGNRICIPKSLQFQMIELAHEGHQGMTRTKCLLREKVWFPKIDEMVESRIKECIACTATYDPKQREPLSMSVLPDYPWQKVSMDFFGPLPTGHSLLVVRDDYSRYPEVDVISSTSARQVIPVLDKLFSQRGVPEEVRTDNGTPFQSLEFREFADYLGFKHHRVTPYWPEANGGAERFMRTLGKAVKCAQLEGKPWRSELNKFLRNYRATPHRVTGVAPATLLNGRPMRVRLPHVDSTVNNPVVEKRDSENKQKMKHYAESRRNVKPSSLKVGDRVLMKNVVKKGKLDSKFDSNPFVVERVKGSMVEVKRGGEVKMRNSSHFRKVSVDPDLCKQEVEESEIPVENSFVENQGNSVPVGNVDRNPTEIICDSNPTETTPDSLHPVDPVDSSDFGNNGVHSNVSISQDTVSVSPSNPVLDQTPVCRRSKRSVKLPKRYKDFSVNVPKLKR